MDARCSIRAILTTTVSETARIPQDRGSCLTGIPRLAVQDFVPQVEIVACGDDLI